MHSNVKYARLPLSPDVEPSKFAFLKISRFKCVAIIFITFMALVFVGVSCLRWNAFNSSPICNLTQNRPSVTPFIHEKEHFRFAHTNRRLPQCLIIGARKAGTRALLNYLNIHPDIVTKGSEMHFFDDDSFYGQSLEAYRKKMPYTYEGQITIEKTPAYFTEPKVPIRVYRMNHTIKILLLLRDPVVRAHSDYLQIAERMKLKNKEFVSFEQNCIDKYGNINKSYKAISRSVYHRHLYHWLEVFSLDQIHIIDSDELVSNPYETVRKVETFLGLEHKIKPENFYFNKTKGFYCIKTDVIQKCLTESKGRTHPEIDSYVLYKLRQFFAPHNQKLYKQINRNFGWPEE